MVCRYDLVWAVLSAPGRPYPYTAVRFSSAPGSDPEPAPDSRRSTVRTDPEPPSAVR